MVFSFHSLSGLAFGPFVTLRVVPIDESVGPLF
jgi:hypothetical protein